jgi:hypothetical protein
VKWVSPVVIFFSEETKQYFHGKKRKFQVDTLLKDDEVKGIKLS